MSAQKPRPGQPPRYLPEEGDGVYYAWVHWAVLESELSGDAKLVYLALAKHADKDTARCFPKLETLARCASRSRSSVWRALGELEASGLVMIRQRRTASGGMQMVNEYTLLQPAMVDNRLTTPVKTSPRQPDAAGPGEQCRAVSERSGRRCRRPAAPGQLTCHLHHAQESAVVGCQADIQMMSQGHPDDVTGTSRTCQADIVTRTIEQEPVEQEPVEQERVHSAAQSGAGAAAPGLPSPDETMAATLRELCRQPSANGSMTHLAQDLLRAGYTLEHIGRFGDWWRQNLATQHRGPTLDEVRNYIGRVAATEEAAR